MGSKTQMMKDQQPPPDVLERSFARLARGHLVKAIKPLISGGYSLRLLQPALKETIQRLYAAGSFNEILSAYFKVGAPSSLEVVDLILRIYKKNDLPSFLKQVYRFDVLDDFSEEVQVAIEWHRSRNLPDAEAWARKFRKITEQLELSGATTEALECVEVLEEECVEKPNIPTKTLTLRPQRIPASSPVTIITDEDKNDPYIVSRTARCKLERANREHERTLGILSRFLSSHGIGVNENKLIDAFAELPSGPAIFEIKSINEKNERDQVRRAISQLYEYRFLHNISRATLWVVFSQPPESAWLLEYLSNDRGINVLWVVQDELSGRALGQLLTTEKGSEKGSANES